MERVTVRCECSREVTLVVEAQRPFRCTACGCLGAVISHETLIICDSCSDEFPASRIRVKGGATLCVGCVSGGHLDVAKATSEKAWNSHKGPTSWQRNN